MAPLTFPAGTVTTDRPGPGNNPYGIPWTNVSRWEPLFTQAAGEAHVPPQLIAAMAVVESDANQYRTLQRTGTPDEVIGAVDNLDPHPSIGIMQVKPFFHQATLPDADVFTPEGNIRLGARLMRIFIDQTGSWENAIREKYHPGVSPNGTTPQMYVDTINALMAEMGGTGGDGASCPPFAAPAFEGTLKVVNELVFHPARQTVRSKVNGLNARQFANTQACLTRAPLHTGETINVLYWVRGEAVGGEDRWWVAEDGARIWSGGTHETPDVAGPDLSRTATLVEAMRAAGMCVSQGPFESFSHAICDCYDFAVPVGTPLPALARGEVVEARFVAEDAIGDPDFVYRPGKVTVRSTDGFGDHVYAHLSRIDVGVGQVLEAGTLLGLSGDRNGPHLHLQLDGGHSPAGLNLTQILAAAGFDVNAFPRC